MLPNIFQKVSFNNFVAARSDILYILLIFFIKTLKLHFFFVVAASIFQFALWLILVVFVQLLSRITILKCYPNFCLFFNKNPNLGESFDDDLHVTSFCFSFKYLPFWFVSYCIRVSQKYHPKIKHYKKSSSNIKEKHPFIKT